MSKKQPVNNSTAAITPDDLWNIFYWGVGYGQLLMEEERESEEIFDAFICASHARKTSMKSNSVQRRQIHSEKWFEAQREGYQKWLAFYKEFCKQSNTTNPQDKK